MPAYSQDQVPVEFEADVATARAVAGGGMTIAFERLSAGVETAPLYKGLPDDACQSRTGATLISGRLRIVYRDRRTEVDARRPGLLPAAGAQRRRRGGRARRRVLSPRTTRAARWSRGRR
jgi:hypothetical protein